MKFKKYTYGNCPDLVPFDCDGYIEGYDEYCRAVDVDPEDEEINVCTLSEDWNGHKEGSIVVTGLQLPNYQFAVFNKVYGE